MGMMRSLLGVALCIAVVSAKGHGSEKKQEKKEEKKEIGAWYEVGDYRVQCLTPSLIRIEPKGPGGFEDRETFMVRNRSIGGVPIQNVEESDDGTTLRTDYYSIQISADGYKIYSTDGDTLWDSGEQEAYNTLNWPSPFTTVAYGLVDHPRFVVPEWTVAPRSEEQTVEEDLAATNGYDFRNDVDGDTYIFLMGEGVKGYMAARKDFVDLCGEVPLLPDYAFGTWFTWWHPYTEWEAKDDLERWNNDELPIDIWGLDMNWRHIHDDWDREYNHPNDSSFEDLDGFIRYLWEDKKLRTFFNDHPYPSAPQLSDGEIGFRWDGLTRWMEKGVHFWWFDHNWKFSIPPPFTEGSDKDSEWEGLTTVSWGSHVFYSIVEHYDKYNRDPAGDTVYGRPMTLSKAMVPDWEEGMSEADAAQSPSQHRYPVWWTGDKVTLQASVESMVDAGVHHMKPYVHSDCGGDYFAQAGDLLRWTEHCTFGTIFRYHGCDHRPWMWGMHTEAKIRNYLWIRYRMQPSLVAAGFKATLTGFPLVARCDLYWPWIEDSRSNSQYIFLEDLLVAPITDASDNWTSRNVWFPPGEWQDVWDGTIYQGDSEKGTSMDKSLPYEKIPLYYKRDGGLIVLVDDPKLRTDDQDWSSLTLEAFPSEGWCQTNRTVWEKSIEKDPAKVGHQHVQMTSDGKGKVTVDIGKMHTDSPDGEVAEDQRAWVVRFNLRPETYLESVSVDGEDIEDVVHIYPAYGRLAARLGFFPLQGAGGSPAPFAGPVAEVKVPSGSHKRKVIVKIAKGTPDMESLVQVQDDAGPLLAATGSTRALGSKANAKIGVAAACLICVMGVAALALRWARVGRGSSIAPDDAHSQAAPLVE